MLMRNATNPDDRFPEKAPKKFIYEKLNGKGPILSYGTLLPEIGFSEEKLPGFVAKCARQDISLRVGNTALFLFSLFA